MSWDWIVPQRHPVVRPERHTELPMLATLEPAMRTSAPLPCSPTHGRLFQSPLVSIQDQSLPGNVDARIDPIATQLLPAVGLPALPQWPALTKPPFTAKPTEHSV